MSISTIQNFYKETITRAVSLVGATNIYVSALPTPSEGYVVISPSSSSLREIVYYTAKGTDGNGSYLTVTADNRGLGGTTAQTHVIGEPVRMNVTAEHIQEISDALDQIVAGGAQDASTITKGITKLSVAPASATEPIAVGDNDPRVPVADPTTLFAPIKFGGTGADGALAITSGTTTIDLGGEAVVTKNYTSISITGDGKLAFSNPHANGTTIVLKSQGNVTLTSSTAPMINVDYLGAAAGNDGYSPAIFKTNRGTNATISDAGTGGALPTLALNSSIKSILSGKYPQVVPGAGGGIGVSCKYPPGGGASVINAGGTPGTGENATGGTPGTGGRGGGALIIECAGAFNFTTTGGISAKGQNGGNSTGKASSGAGGGGGCVVVFYNSLTANTGTIIVSGGTRGTPGTCSPGGYGADGGDGYSLVALNTEFN